MSFIRFRNVFALAAILAVLTVPCLAQVSTASVIGTVVDPAGAIVPNAAVNLANIATGVDRRSTTNGAGAYAILNVAPGDYVLSASAPGFRTAKLAQFTLVVNQTARFDLKLEVGEMQSSVTVEATTTVIQTATSELGAAVSEASVKALPLNGRNFTQMLWLAPGATPVSTGQNKSGGYLNPVGTFVAPSINGQLSRSNMYLLDGVINQESFMGTYSVAPIVDSIQEFKVQSHNDLPEFGQILGGTVNVVTKSGTNQLHGTVWEYIRNDAFDARNTFLKSVSPFKQNMFGVETGGPVVLPKIYHGQNRTFFSAAYEGFRFRSPAATLYRVPTAANLTGDLSDETRQIYNPYTTRVDPNKAGSYIRDVFPGNQIPASMLSTAMVSYAKATLPTPVTTSVANRNAIDNTETIQGQNAYHARIDHNIGQSNFFWFRISGSRQYKDGSSGREAIASSQQFNARNIGVSYMHTFGASSVLQAQFGSSRLISPLYRSMSKLSSDYFKNLGLSDSLINNFIDNTRIDPGFSPSDWWSGNGYYLYNRPSDDKQYKVNFSKVHGSHIFKAGADLASTDNHMAIALSSVGFTTLQTASPSATGTTGSALASYLLGVPDSAARRNTVESMQWGGVMGLYAQDQWKATQKLTINFGLRYDRNFIPPFGQDKDNNRYTGNIDFNRGVYVLLKQPASCASGATTACLPSGSLPDHVELSPNGKIIHDPTKNFQPRLGMAYRLRPATVVRAAAGIVFDNWSGIQQASRNYAGMWPSLGYLTVSNLNPISAAPTTTAVNPLPSAVSPAASPFLATGYYIDPNWKNAYSIQYNIGIQHQLNATTVLSAGYVGSGTRRLDVGGYYNVATTPGAGTAADRRPYPYINPSNYTRSWGSANYHSLQLMADGRMAKGMTYRLSYTWSKSIDYGSSGFFAAEDYSVQNPYNISGDKSVSGYDIPHVLSASWVYQLPFGKGKAVHTGSRAADYIIGNWQFNGIALFRSGAPFNLTVTGDLANTGNTGYLRPNAVGDWHRSNRSTAAWFNTAAFAVPSAYTFGSAGRNILRADWVRNFDMSVFRQFPLKGERSKLELRVESFNLFNTPCYSAPTANISSADFGKVFSTANAARQLQLSLKLTF